MAKLWRAQIGKHASHVYTEQCQQAAEYEEHNELRQQ